MTSEHIIIKSSETSGGKIKCRYIMYTLKKNIRLTIDCSIENKQEHPFSVLKWKKKKATQHSKTNEIIFQKERQEKARPTFLVVEWQPMNEEVTIQVLVMAYICVAGSILSMGHAAGS